MTDSPSRLFYALWPDAQVRLQLAAATERLQERHPRLGGYRVNPQRHHVTLYFLGDRLAEDAALRLATGIKSAAFDLRFDRAGSFRNRQIPVWLGCSSPPAACVELGRALRAALDGPAIPTGPDFVPHVTVLRDASRRLPTEPVEPIDWKVREFVLVRSVLGPRPRYEVLHSYPLG
jgi:2'-5' RNA ligase